MEVLTNNTGENFTHKMLWSVCIRQIRHMRSSPIGETYDAISAMIFASHAFEAYLNYLGERLAPEIWIDERNYFRREPYRGFHGKVRRVFELCEIPEPARDVTSYSTIWTLKDLRDIIAHGKTESFKTHYAHSISIDPPPFRGRFRNLVSTKKAEQAQVHTEAVARLLHAAAKTKVTDPWFGDEPFEGIQGYGVRSSHLL